VSELPDSANAGGIRAGACNTMASFMPDLFVANASGHDLKGYSSLFDYLDVSVALCIPGGIVLAGWPALPWGQLGMGPVPPSIAPLEVYII
jgi:hypothetical protein